MKKFAKFTAVALCALTLTAGLTACADKVEIIEDDNPYSFTNKDHAVAKADADMIIDGKFDEARWESVRWLNAVDKPNSVQSAKIDFACFIGGKGLYFGMKVEEDGTNIWVNHERSGWSNSCIEMYMGPAGVQDGGFKTFEFDFQADGTIGNTRLNSATGWRDARTVWDIMPVLAAQSIGGEVNTKECYGYQVEAFFPFEYLEFAGWDVSNPEEMLIGIDPVHIFTFNFTGTDATANETKDRLWSRWGSKYMPEMGWLSPDSYFHFDKNGLVSHDYNVTYEGSGRGTVTEKLGFPGYVLGQRDAEFTVRAVNGAEITKLTVNGVDYLNELRYDGGAYVFKVNKPTEDLDVVVKFN